MRKEGSSELVFKNTAKPSIVKLLVFCNTKEYYYDFQLLTVTGNSYWPYFKEENCPNIV